MTWPVIFMSCRDGTRLSDFFPSEVVRRRIFATIFSYWARTILSSLGRVYLSFIYVLFESVKHKIRIVCYAKTIGLCIAAAIWQTCRIQTRGPFSERNTFVTSLRSPDVNATSQGLLRDTFFNVRHKNRENWIDSMVFMALKKFPRKAFLLLVHLVWGLPIEFFPSSSFI